MVTTSPPSSTPTTISLPVTSTSSPSHDLGVFRVDPVTLEPIPGTEPLATGDWITGYGSPNGEWLGLNVWIEPDISVFRVVDIPRGG